MTLRRQLAVVAAVYVIEGFPMGIFRDVWPVYLRESGVSLQWIGAVSGLSVAWSLKVLISPLVDRLGEYRHWITSAMGIVAVALGTVAVLDASQAGVALFTAFVVFCLASATQDVAIDAYTIGLVSRDAVGPVNGVRVTAYRVAILAVGGGALFLPRWLGWHGTHAVLAVCALALAACAALSPLVPRAQARPRLRDVFRRWRSLPGWPRVALFLLSFRLADMAMGPMLRPLWVDRGVPREAIGAWTTAFGSLATIVGGLAGGWLVSRAGIGRALWIAGVLSLASNLVYAAAALPGASREWLYLASLVESACGGLAAAGFLSFLMSICEREYAAIQYATLTSLYAASGALLGFFSGALAQQLGYAGFFVASAALGLPALALLPAVTRWLARSESA